MGTSSLPAGNFTSKCWSEGKSGSSCSTRSINFSGHTSGTPTRYYLGGF
ncbi:hypothetical protein OIU74_012509 [Salix koriyanagi]|uniref:Uncharacterized protein n=1 Tax=Salix koriyanagi TaxID=2511006 RepID=A0A9Q0Q6Y4_9ROSI|nr:hypothetical protein OIU74_012509 [Salix koriyanagi]